MLPDHWKDNSYSFGYFWRESVADELGRPRDFGGANWVIQFCYQTRMDRKTTLLSNLKKQVLALRSQLEVIDRTKHKQSRGSKDSRQCSMSHSSRFNSITYDSTYLDRGVKKYPLGDHKFKNIAEVIYQKSLVQKRPSLSPYRRVECLQTKENFSTQLRAGMRDPKRPPNPLTGQGYSDSKKGIKTLFEREKPKESCNKSKSKKHFYHML